MTDPHRDYFNRLSADWDRMMPPEPRFGEWFERFGVARGDRVLDIGAGTGRATKVLSELVGSDGTVFSTDLAEDMIAEAKARLSGPGKVFACSDGLHLPVRGGCFDKIVCYSAFPHFQDKPGALSEMRRILKAGGKLLILHSVPHEKLNTFHASLKVPVQNDRLPSPRDMSRLLANAGFKVLLAAESDDVYWAEGIKG